LEQKLCKVREILHFNRLTKAYHFVEHGMLKRKHYRYGTQLVVPDSMKMKILFLEHDTHFKAHPGVNTMKVQVRRRYYWKNMDEDIEQYVNSCEGCQLGKAKLSKHHTSMNTRKISQIFQCFSMDLIDMSSISKHYRYILVLMDYYSGFLILTPLRNKKSPLVLKSLWDCLSLFGPPEKILTDNGTEFVNELVTQLTEANGIDHVITFPYTPQGNAKNERSHQQIRQALRIFAAKHPNRWHQYLKKLQYALNTRPNHETLLSAYEILFGLSPRSLHQSTIMENYDPEYMKQVRSDIAHLLQEAQQKQNDIQAKPPPIPLAKGDAVILLNQKPTSKAMFPAHGPFLVKRLIGTSGVIVQHPDTKKVYRVSRRFVRPFHVRKEGGVTGSSEEQDKDTEDKDIIHESEEELITAEEKEDEREMAQMQPDPSHEKDDLQKTNSNTKKRKKGKGNLPRDLKKLRSYNEKTPVVRSEVEAETFAIVKQDSSARLGKIVEVEEETIKVNWYGTTTDKEQPRKRWKWYPGTENDEGEIIFNEKSDTAFRPAYCHILRTDIILTFPRLTVAKTLPLEVLQHVEQLTLT